MLNTNNSVGLPTSSIMTGLLTQRKKRDFERSNSQLLLRETEDGKFYRLRLLNTQPDQKFVNSSNFQHYRDFPFIIQHIHQVWEDVPTGNPEKPIRKVCHTIVCPQTDYVKANSTLTKASCPMCSAYASAWKAYSDSHFKNTEAKDKMRNLHNTFRVLVPVYVVVDPNYEANCGSVKVLSIDEDGYKALLTQINGAVSNNTPIWGTDACDLYFSYGKVEKVKNEGKPNEFRFQKKGFTRIGFTTAPKHLDGLTDELVDDIQFDANWYQVPTKEELDQFYLEHCSSTSVNNDDIPMDIPVAPATRKPAPAPVAPIEDVIPPFGAAEVKNEAVKPVATKKAAVVNEAVSDIPDIPVEKPATVKKAAPAPAPAPIDTDDINARIDGILAGMMG